MMRQRFFTVIFGLVLVGLASTSASAETALAALAKSDCPSGLEHHLPGVYYYCVGRKALAGGNDGKARSMFEIAAAWGSKQAQFMLGLGYFRGDAWARNRPLGLAWLDLAAERQTPLFVAILRSARSHASAAEQAEAARLLQTMKPRYADAHAAHRAFRRYQAFQQQLAAAEPYGGQFCIAGLTSATVAPIGANSTNPDSCAGQQSAGSVARLLDGYAHVLFDRWQGHVTVGDTQPVSGDAADGMTH